MAHEDRCEGALIGQTDRAHSLRATTSQGAAVHHASHKEEKGTVGVSTRSVVVSS